jgi:Tol biopolymer transport system component
VFISIEAGKEVRRLKPCEGSIALPPQTAGPTVTYYAKPLLMSIYPKDGRIAVSCDEDAGSEIVVVEPDLNAVVGRWKVARPVQDLAWSPDGSKLAVLYYDPPNPFDKITGKWIGPPHPYPIEPNVSIVEPRTGKELLRINTQDYDAKVAFSPDGNTIYSITHYFTSHSIWTWNKDTIRSFDANTGALKKRVVVSGTGVRDSLVVSPDGKLIAAGSTTEVAIPFWREQASINVEKGFVILDAQTGAVLFREKLRRAGPASPPPFFFSADGKLLIANFASEGASSNAYIYAYSVEGLP